jgi:hypothetical protein
MDRPSWVIFDVSSVLPVHPLVPPKPDISLHRTKCTRLGMVWTLPARGGTLKRLQLLAHRSFEYMYRATKWSVMELPLQAIGQIMMVTVSV